MINLNKFPKKYEKHLIVKNKKERQKIYIEKRKTLKTNN